METKFTQQITVGSAPLTFLFTEVFVSDNDLYYKVAVLNRPTVPGFSMFHKGGGQFEIDPNVTLPREIMNIAYQLNQAIQNHNIMQSLLSPEKSFANIFREEE